MDVIGSGGKGGPVSFKGLRTVNVVSHTQTLTTPPGPWAGMVVAAGKRRKPQRGGTPTNFLQSRRTLGGSCSNDKRSVLLVFWSAVTGLATSKILAGSSSVADAVAKIYRYEADNGTTSGAHSVICVHNTVVSAGIEAKNKLTLKRLSRSPQAVSTTKFPGA
jgi:hypothetical protein